MDIITEPQYADYIIAYNQFMEPALAEAIEAFAPPLDSRGLDAGCGPGDLFGYFGKRVGEKGEVVGVDLSRNHLEVAAKRFDGVANINILPEPVNLADPLPFPDASFDWAWTADVLWSSSFEDPGAVIKEMGRVTRKGGKVGIFCNGWQRTQLLTGHRHLEFELVRVSDLILRPALSSRPEVDIEYMAGWLREAGMDNIKVSAHTVTYARPIPQHAKNYLDCVLAEDYIPALEVTSYTAEEKAKILPLLTPGSSAYIPDQPHYYCCKTGILVQGEVV